MRKYFICFWSTPYLRHLYKQVASKAYMEQFEKKYPENEDTRESKRAGRVELNPKLL